jgi:hypothetical protein
MSSIITKLQQKLQQFAPLLHITQCQSKSQSQSYSCAKNISQYQRHIYSQATKDQLQPTEERRELHEPKPITMGLIRSATLRSLL